MTRPGSTSLKTSRWVLIGRWWRALAADRDDDSDCFCSSSFISTEESDLHRFDRHLPSNQLCVSNASLPANQEEVLAANRKWLPQKSIYLPPDFKIDCYWSGSKRLKASSHLTTQIIYVSLVLMADWTCCCFQSSVISWEIAHFLQIGNFTFLSLLFFPAFLRLLRTS